MTNEEMGTPVVLKQCEVNIHIDHSKTGVDTNKHRDINNDSYCQMIAA